MKMSQPKSSTIILIITNRRFPIKSLFKSLKIYPYPFLSQRMVHCWTQKVDLKVPTEWGSLVSQSNICKQVNFFIKKRLTASLKTFNLYIIVPLKTDASEARPTWCKNTTIKQNSFQTFARRKKLVFQVHINLQ